MKNAHDLPQSMLLSIYHNNCTVVKFHQITVDFFGIIFIIGFYLATYVAIKLKLYDFI
jgi:hypothetical protein